MLSYIYIPFDAFQRSWSARPGLYEKTSCVIGYRLGPSYVVVDILENASHLQLSKIDPELEILGYTNCSGAQRAEPNHVYLRFHRESRLPYVDPELCPQTQRYTIIYFAPPNLRNLEYFTVRPILLQNTNMAHTSEPYVKNLQDVHVEMNTQEHFSICNENVLERVNACSKVRGEIKAQRAVATRTSRNAALAQTRSLLSGLKAACRTTLVWPIYAFIFVFSQLISILNTPFFGVKPVESSTWCRQLDLRLRQVSFFPFQFLSYYDKEFLSQDVQKQLGIQVPNELYNINNSNYINLYNTIWLMFNDILIGYTIHGVVWGEWIHNFHVINEFLYAVCFTKLDGFISWIGSDYPGGFKLNNDLGQFLQSLFSWSARSCSEVFQVFALSSSHKWYTYIFTVWFKLSCYFGVSFIVALCIDYVRLFNVHTYVFNMAATKIYHKQVDMLKSLMELFRGRKYNVLRSRIDKIEEDQLRIDQLLLGTFVFLVLIYLLPTTFAFYCLFYAYQVIMNTLLNIGDKVILCFNLYPLFVVLLKLKNSRRLQGGVHFVCKGGHATTDWVLMENKALTFDEICRNFVYVFRQEGSFDRLFFNFVEGHDLHIRDTSSLKFQYLMLPQNHECLAEVWKGATGEGLA